MEYGLRVFFQAEKDYTNLGINADGEEIPAFTFPEVCIYHDIMLIMCVIRLASVKWYWRGYRGDEVPAAMSFSLPDFTPNMAYKRFTTFRRRLRFNDYSLAPERVPGYDRLWKVRPMIELVQGICLGGMMSLGEWVSADERSPHRA